jgi:hypothetical protein
VYVCMCMYKIVGLSGEAKGRRWEGKTMMGVNNIEVQCV